MAVYDYKCENCGDIQVEMRISEYKPVEECPQCKGKVERIYKPIIDVWKCSGSYKKSGEGNGGSN